MPPTASSSTMPSAINMTPQLSTPSVADTHRERLLGYTSNSNRIIVIGSIN